MIEAHPGANSRNAGQWGANFPLSAPVGQNYRTAVTFDHSTHKFKAGKCAGNTSGAVAGALRTGSAIRMFFNHILGKTHHDPATAASSWPGPGMFWVGFHAPPRCAVILALSPLGSMPLAGPPSGSRFGLPPQFLCPHRPAQPSATAVCPVNIDVLVDVASVKLGQGWSR